MPFSNPVVSTVSAALVVFCAWQLVAPLLGLPHVADERPARGGRLGIAVVYLALGAVAAWVVVSDLRTGSVRPAVWAFLPAAYIPARIFGSTSTNGRPAGQ